MFMRLIILIYWVFLVGLGLNLNVWAELPTLEGGGIKIESGKRAVAIRVNERTSVGGWALPGSRVDVVLTSVNSDGVLESNVIAENARVVSLEGSKTRVGRMKKKGTITLEVGSEEALKILTGQRMALLNLVLRAEEDFRALKVRSISAEEIIWSGEELPEEVQKIFREKLQGGFLRTRYCMPREGSGTKVGTKAWPQGYNFRVKSPVFSQCR